MPGGLATLDPLGAAPALVAAALHEVRQQGGVVLTLGAACVRASWNTHRACLRHPGAAARCAVGAAG